MVLFILLILSTLIVDLLLYAGLHPLLSKLVWNKRRRIALVYWVLSMFMVLIILLALLFRNQVTRYELLALYYYAFSLFVVVYVAKIIVVIFLILRWLVNVGLKVVGLRRSPMIFWIIPGFVMALLFSGVLLWGVLWGRFDFRVESMELTFDSLPESFDGYTIVQISDLHLGSWWGFDSYLERALKMVQDQKPDLIVFTGDLVNNYAEEIPPFIPMLQQLSAPDEVFAVMGNHDYGRYYHWRNPEDSLLNVERIREGYAQCGFRLLNNMAVFLVRGQDSIRLMGTENGSNLPFPPIAALPSESLSQTDSLQRVDSISVYERYFHILLTHDPIFWNNYAVQKNIPLTLSGHSHGFQVSVRVGGKEWNPFKKFYPYTNGLFEKNERILYVNRGLGWIGYAGRISVFPEITRIVLRKKR